MPRMKKGEEFTINKQVYVVGKQFSSGSGGTKVFAAQHKDSGEQFVIKMTALNHSQIKKQKEEFKERSQIEIDAWRQMMSSPEVQKKVGAKAGSSAQGIQFEVQGEGKSAIAYSAIPRLPGVELNAHLKTIDAKFQKALDSNDQKMAWEALQEFVICMQKASQALQEFQENTGRLHGDANSANFMYDADAGTMTILDFEWSQKATEATKVGKGVPYPLLMGRHPTQPNMSIHAIEYYPEEHQNNNIRPNSGSDVYSIATMITNMSAMNKAFLNGSIAGFDSNMQDYLQNQFYPFMSDITNGQAYWKDFKDKLPDNRIQIYWDFKTGLENKTPPLSKEEKEKALEKFINDLIENRPSPQQFGEELGYIINEIGKNLGIETPAIADTASPQQKHEQTSQTPTPVDVDYTIYEVEGYAELVNPDDIKKVTPDDIKKMQQQLQELEKAANTELPQQKIEEAKALLQELWHIQDKRDALAEQARLVVEILNLANAASKEINPDIEKVEAKAQPAIAEAAATDYIQPAESEAKLITPQTTENLTETNKKSNMLENLVRNVSPKKVSSKFRQVLNMWREREQKAQKEKTSQKPAPRKKSDSKKKDKPSKKPK